MVHDNDDIMLVGPTEQELYRLIDKTLMDQRVREKPDKHSETFHLSEISGRLMMRGISRYHS